VDFNDETNGLKIKFSDLIILALYLMSSISFHKSSRYFVLSYLRAEKKAESAINGIR